jgi:hypothetical protein
VALRLVAIICCLGLLGTLGETVFAKPGVAVEKKKKCKRGQVRKRGKCVKRRPPPKPPKAPLHSRYVDSQNALTLDLNAKTVNYEFYVPCEAPGNNLNGSNGPDGMTFALPGTKAGTALDLSGSYTSPRIGQSTPQTTDWHMKGKFTSASRFDGTLEFSADVPAEEFSAPAHCDYPPKPIHLGG